MAAYSDLVNLVFSPMKEKEAATFQMDSFTRPLGIRIPSAVYKALVTQHDLEEERPITHLFIKDNKATFDTFPQRFADATLAVLSVTAFSKMSEATVKLNWHGLLILKLFCLVSYMFPGCQVAEDVTEKHSGAMTVPGLRRDLYIWINDFLVFFGEVKADRKELGKAESELLSKTTQEYVQQNLSKTLPYIFGIAVAKNIAKFFVYHLTDYRIEVIKCKDQDEFDYNSVLHRVPIVTIFVNILRWMRWAIPKLQQTRSLSMTKDCILGGGSTTLKENEDHFLKTFKVPQVHQQRLCKIYHHLLLRHFVNAATYKVYINNVEVDENTILTEEATNVHKQFTLEVRPKGTMEIPPNGARLFTAVTDIVGYLSSMHSKHIVHRDLRWPNIPFDPQSGHYFVIDHETASMAGELLFWRPGHPSFFFAEVQTGSRVYEIADDIFQLGALIFRALQVRLDRHAWTEEQVESWLGVAEACQMRCTSLHKISQMLDAQKPNLQ